MISKTNNLGKRDVKMNCFISRSITLKERILIMAIQVFKKIFLDWWQKYQEITSVANIVRAWRPKNEAIAYLKVMNLRAWKRKETVLNSHTKKALLREFSKFFFSLSTVVDKWQCIFCRNQLIEHQEHKSHQRLHRKVIFYFQIQNTLL